MESQSPGSSTDAGLYEMFTPDFNYMCVPHWICRYLFLKTYLPLRAFQEISLKFY